MASVGVRLLRGEGERPRWSRRARASAEAIDDPGVVAEAHSPIEGGERLDLNAVGVVVLLALLGRRSPEGDSEGLLVESLEGGRCERPLLRGVVVPRPAHILGADLEDVLQIVAEGPCLDTLALAAPLCLAPQLIPILASSLIGHFHPV